MFNRFGRGEEGWKENPLPADKLERIVISSLKIWFMGWA
jgi:hypothetical protein